MGLIKNLSRHYRRSRALDVEVLRTLLPKDKSDISYEEETITEKIKRKGFPLMISYVSTRHDN